MGVTHRLRVFVEWMQQKIRVLCGTRDEVREDWRRPNNEKLHDVYFSPDNLLIFSRRMRWEGHVARMVTEEVRTWFWTEERRPLGRGKSRLECTTKIEL